MSNHWNLSYSCFYLYFCKHLNPDEIQLSYFHKILFLRWVAFTHCRIYWFKYLWILLIIHHLINYLALLMLIHLLKFHLMKQSHNSFLTNTSVILHCCFYFKAFYQSLCYWVSSVYLSSLYSHSRFTLYLFSQVLFLYRSMQFLFALRTSLVNCKSSLHFSQMSIAMA
jgi:hypothetical protein